jgi:hypothetical protein
MGPPRRSDDGSHHDEAHTHVNTLLLVAWGWWQYREAGSYDGGIEIRHGKNTA